MSNSLLILGFLLLCLAKIHGPAIRNCVTALIFLTAAILFIAAAILDDLLFPTGEDLNQ